MTTEGNPNIDALIIQMYIQKSLKTVKSLRFLFNLSHACLWTGACSSIEASFIGRPFPHLLEFPRLKVLLINHSLSSLCCLCCDKYAFVHLFLQFLNFFFIAFALSCVDQYLLSIVLSFDENAS